MKDRRLEEATNDYYRYQEEQEVLRLTRNDSENDMIGRYDALFGKHLKTTNPLLSPKIAQILRS